jgi:hypothetical protein
MVVPEAIVIISTDYATRGFRAKAALWDRCRTNAIFGIGTSGNGTGVKQPSF